MWVVHKREQLSGWTQASWLRRNGWEKQTLAWGVILADKDILRPRRWNSRFEHHFLGGIPYVPRIERCIEPLGALSFAFFLPGAQ
jgi:hypothetical protein